MEEFLKNTLSNAILNAITLIGTACLAELHPDYSFLIVVIGGTFVSAHAFGAGIYNEVHDF